MPFLRGAEDEERGRPVRSVVELAEMLETLRGRASVRPKLAPSQLRTNRSASSLTILRQVGGLAGHAGPCGPNAGRSWI